MENQDDIDYVHLLQSQICKKNEKQNRPTEESNKNYGISDKMTLKRV
jgi:hypothetical protein